MPEELTKEQKVAKLGNLERAGKEYLDEATKLRAELGLPASNGGGSDLEAQLSEQDQLAALYDRLPPGEVTNLYHTDRPKWQKIMDAVRDRSTRNSKLFKSPVP